MHFLAPPLLEPLLVFAVKYNQEQGHVRVFLDADYKYFYLKVEDSGIGIPQEAQNHIFERFYPHSFYHCILPTQDKLPARSLYFLFSSFYIPSLYTT